MFALGRSALQAKVNAITRVKLPKPTYCILPSDSLVVPKAALKIDSNSVVTVGQVKG